MSSIDGKLTCDMERECSDPVTHIGAKGYIYCARHAPLRRGWERTRKIKKWEMDLLEQAVCV